MALEFPNNPKWQNPKEQFDARTFIDRLFGRGEGTPVKEAPPTVPPSPKVGIIETEYQVKPVGLYIIHQRKVMDLGAAPGKVRINGKDVEIKEFCDNDKKYAERFGSKRTRAAIATLPDPKDRTFDLSKAKPDPVKGPKTRAESQKFDTLGKIEKRLGIEFDANSVEVKVGYEDRLTAKGLEKMRVITITSRMPGSSNPGDSYEVKIIGDKGYFEFHEFKNGECYERSIIDGKYSGWEECPEPLMIDGKYSGRLDPDIADEVNNTDWVSHAK